MSDKDSWKLEVEKGNPLGKGLLDRKDVKVEIASQKLYTTVKTLYEHFVKDTDNSIFSSG